MDYINRKIARADVEIVPLALLKDHLRVDHSHEDTLIRSYLGAALDWLETRCKRAFVPTTYQMTTPAIDDCFDLPVGPLVSVESVKYYDEDNTLQTVESADYWWLPRGEGIPGFVDFVDTWDKPIVYERPDAWQVYYTSGEASMPDNATLALLQLASYYYENRSESNTGVLVVAFQAGVPASVESLAKTLATGFYSV